MQLNAYKDFQGKSLTKKNWLDVFSFSWDIHGTTVFSKFLPKITELISS